MNTKLEFEEDDILSEVELSWLIQVMRGLTEQREELQTLMKDVIRQQIIKKAPFFLEDLKRVNTKLYDNMVDNMVLEAQHRLANHDKIHLNIAKKMEKYRKLVYGET